LRGPWISLCTEGVKNARRFLSFFTPEGLPKKVRVYDCGEDSIERYTVVFTGTYRKKTNGSFWYLGMSENPFHPQGIGMHGEDTKQIDRPSYSHLGKKIEFTDMTVDAQRCTLNTYIDLWDFNTVPKVKKDWKK